ncbi:MAG: formylglycine-generating enzyme family protein, partial [Symploca sp. SIO1B1]|nr:formylglycine-generating enzyme family protein [Symploca sp. SIO1B1]
MTPNPANRRIASFEKRFGKPHLYLAYHAAFPLALTADLLYHLWINFQQDIHGRLLDIPWVAVADILLSPLCEEVGRELYEMDGEVRQELLKQLQADANFSQQRVLQLSNFLLEYVQQQLYSDNPDIQDFAQAQQWTALAYKQPKDAARKLALAYTQLDYQDLTELIRLESVVETLTEPLREFPQLQIYACGMAYFARGELAQATVQLKRISKIGNRIQVAGVSLPIPEEIRKTRSLTRRRLLQITGLTGLGLGTAMLLPRVRQPSAPLTHLLVTGQLKNFDFEAVTVNAQGQVTKTQRHQAQFFSQELRNGVTLDMVAIPGGNFLIGAPVEEKGNDDDELPQQEITIQPFFMSKYPITQVQWRAVATLPRVDRFLKRNPSRFKGDNLPVESVSWHEAN